jgi:putative transposase
MSSTFPLFPGQVYHIYNRGNNREDIFREDRNYVFFLELYAKYVLPVVDTFAYCLLKNHFHLLIRVKDLTGSSANLSGQENANLSGQEKAVSQAFSNFFNAYTKAFNKEYDRTGSLFQRAFGRRLVRSNEYFLALIAYIHQNPQRHGLIGDFQEWKYSSYKSILSRSSTHLERDEVLEWFQGREQFSRFHQSEILASQVCQWVAEDIP